jgi:hypothetical protein
MFFDWMQRSVVAIALVMFFSFFPFTIQLIVEFGPQVALIRIFKQVNVMACLHATVF